MTTQIKSIECSTILRVNHGVHVSVRIPLTVAQKQQLLLDIFRFVSIK